ncbi:MAG: hypothetical protein NTV22_15525 [bacterium]|nr:hypothetical protein [bacterium]
MTTAKTLKSGQSLPIKARFGNVYGKVSGKHFTASVDAGILLAFIAVAAWSSLRRLWRHFHRAGLV